MADNDNGGVWFRLTKQRVEFNLNPERSPNDLRFYLMYHAVIAVLLIAVIGVIAGTHEALAWGCLFIVGVPAVLIAAGLLLRRGPGPEQPVQGPPGPGPQPEARTVAAPPEPAAPEPSLPKAA